MPEPDEEDGAAEQGTASNSTALIAGRLSTLAISTVPTLAGLAPLEPHPGLLSMEQLQPTTVPCRGPAHVAFHFHYQRHDMEEWLIRHRDTVRVRLQLLQACERDARVTLKASEGRSWRGRRCFG